MLARKLWTVFVGMAVAAAIGAVAGYQEAKRLEPLTLWDRRDAFLGSAITLVVLRRAPEAPPKPGT